MNDSQIEKICHNVNNANTCIIGLLSELRKLIPEGEGDPLFKTIAEQIRRSSDTVNKVAAEIDVGFKDAG